MANDDDRDLMRGQFDGAAELARSAGQSESASRFDRLCATVQDISSELLGTYLEMFEDLPDGEVDVSLMEAIHRGSWSPESATEYVQRFVAFRSGTETFRFE